MPFRDTPPRLERSACRDSRRPDTDLLARLEVTDPPPATRTVGLTALTQARTSAPEILVAEGYRSVRSYPMGYASFLGSIGVLLAVDDGSRVLLAGDAVWGNLQIRLLREKAQMPGALFDADRDAAFATIHRLHALPACIEVIAAHDHAAITARVRH